MPVSSIRVPSAEKTVTSDLKMVEEACLSFADRLLLKELEIATFNALHEAVTSAEILDEAVKYRSLVRQHGVKKDLCLAEMQFDHNGNVAGACYVETTNRMRSYAMIRALKPNENAAGYSDRQMAICNGLMFYPPAKASEHMTPRIAQNRTLADRIKQVSDTSQRNVFNAIKTPLVDKDGVATEAKAEISELKAIYDLLAVLIKMNGTIDSKDTVSKEHMQVLLSYIFNISNDVSKSAYEKLNVMVVAIQRSALQERMISSLLEGVDYNKAFVVNNDAALLERLSMIIQAGKYIKSAAIADYDKILATKFPDRQKVNMIVGLSHQAMQKRKTPGFFAIKNKRDNEVNSLHELLAQYATDQVEAVKDIERLCSDAKPRHLTKQVL